MGSPTAAQIHSFTDCLAARIAAALAGAKAGFEPAAIASLYDLVDASGDPAVETALLTHALACDVAALPESQYALLPKILEQHADARAFVSALNNLVVSASGGSYASMRAYLVDKSAKLHPLAGELFRLALGQECFTASSVVAGVSNPTYSAIFPDRVYVGADGSLAAETTDALSAGTGDVTLFGSDNHTLYVGCERRFNAVVVALSTLANTTITPTFQYWNGNAWTTLTVTDNSVGFTKNDAITFTPPSDWGRWYKDAGGTAFADLARLYWVRIARTADTVNTPPVGTSVFVMPVFTPSGSGLSTHLGVQQPALALIRITAASTVTVTLPATLDYTRFAHPLSSEGKIRLRALTPIAQDLTVTLAYVDQDGANGSTAQSAWTAPASGGAKVVALTNTTDGIRSARTTTSVSTTATEGVCCLELLPIRDPAV